MELLLIGVAACTAYDVVSIRRKGRQPLSSCQLVVKAERTEHHPRVFTAIHVHFILGGDGLQQAKVERAIQLSAQKYCSASIMLGQAVPITHDYELHPAT